MESSLPTIWPHSSQVRTGKAASISTDFPGSAWQERLSKIDAEANGYLLPEVSDLGTFSAAAALQPHRIRAKAAEYLAFSIREKVGIKVFEPQSCGPWNTPSFPILVPLLWFLLKRKRKTRAGEKF